MNSIDNYLAQIEDILIESKTVPFSGKVAVDREAIYDIIDGLRANLPDEMHDAQKIVESRERFLGDAEKKSIDLLDDAQIEADNIIAEAENTAKMLVSEHEIYQRSLAEAERIMGEVDIEARELRLDAMDYADQVLAKSEEALRITLDSVANQNHRIEEYFDDILNKLHQNRQELRGN